MAILFKPKHRDMILSGAKTQTRRAWKRNRTRPESVHWATTRMFDKDGKSRFARLHIRRVWLEELGAISTSDARKEGYPTPKEFFAAFAGVNKIKMEDLDLNQLVWCVEFEVVQ